MTLAEFLAARLDEDERRARRIAPNQAPIELRAMTTRDGGQPFLVIDSARVLREVAAKRAILARWQKSADDPRDIRLIAHEELRGNLALLWAVRQMAAVYSDHPDYDPA